MEVNESIAKQFEDTIKEHADTAIKYLTSGEYDLGAVYAKDARDFKSILDMYRAGDIENAVEKAEYLDTAARDNIPLDFWEIEKKASLSLR